MAAPQSTASEASMAGIRGLLARVATVTRAIGKPGKGLQSRKMARSAGFEPTTPGFGGQYSIQLSYDRVGREA